MNHSVSHLKLFGCGAYAHVSDELRKKLDKKGQKCIFVGYSEDTKAYKLYAPVARKVIISRDVQFVDNDDMEEEVVQTPYVSQLIIAPSNPMTLRHGSTQGTSIQVTA